MQCGATKEQWDALVKLGLTADLLPVVSNHKAVISPLSSIQKLGKTPTRYNSSRQVGGIKEWTSYQATEADILKWSKEPDYGICIQTRHVRALDVDITDPALADVVLSTIKCRFPDAAIRTRPDSPKFLFPFFLEGDFFYRSIQTDEGQIEFLANGKQFIAAGTHESGAKYSLDIPNIITLTKDEFENLFSDLHDQYSNNTYEAANRPRNPKCEPLDIEDDLPEKLQPFVLGTGRDGQLFIECPFKDEHSTKGSMADTAYFPAGTRAYFNGHFHCFHAHCQHRTDEDFKFALGIDDFHDTLVPDDAAPVLVPSSSSIITSPGLIQDTADWITKSSFKQQPTLSLLTTLAFAGAVFGRRYVTEKENTRTNLYVVGIAETGEGKDHPRKRIKTLAAAANLTNFIGADDVTSGQGMRKALVNSPSHVSLLDEIGMLFQGIVDPKSPMYYRVSGKILTELYSSSSSIYKAGEYASDAEQVILVEPNLCLYGTTTLEKYKGCVSNETIRSGELNRFIVMMTPGEIPYFNENIECFDVPEALARRWAYFATTFADGGNPPKIIVKSTPEAKEAVKNMRVYEVDRQREFNTRTGDGTGPLYARYTENSIKLAMIYAIGDNADRPLITLQHLKAGESIVKNGILFIRAMIESGMLSDAATGARKEFKADQDAIVAFIRARKTAGKTDILRAFRHLKSREVDDIMTNLKASGYVTVEESKNTKGPKTFIYRATKDAE